MIILIKGVSRTEKTVLANNALFQSRYVGVKCAVSLLMTSMRLRYRGVL